MVDRILILGVVVLGVAAIWGLVRVWQYLAVRRMQVASPFATLVPAGRPAVISFSTPTCGECRTRQAPALTRLSEQFGANVTILKLSAPEHSELVEQAGILTVPATIVLDGFGVVRHLNLGFTDTNRLAEQVQNTSKSLPSMV
ncbi:MAG: thioredoxin family protein [Roseiflexaceae bacterium]|nr:thioredoxin family protein [Roseiflexaceae bacterium]